MQFYNSISRRKDALEPVEPGKISLYVCGLTPYDHTHIGHARTYVAFDMLKRYLILKGYKVFHIQNITDVDDKIINRAKQNSEDPRALASRFHNEALELFGKLHILPADAYPKVTERIPDIISLVQKLVSSGYAYETETGVYFEVRKFANYGKLSGQKQDEIIAGSRKEVDESKRNPEDFALWKKTKNEIIEFESPWGTGRPGWHIECSAMAGSYAKTIDIHGGARDLIFPHHENEIAQSEAAGSNPFVKYWLHTGFLTVKGEKMSKSLGNFITLKDVLAEHSPNAVRMFFALANYRSPIDYNPAQIRQAQSTVEHLFGFMDSLDATILAKNGKGKKNESLEIEISRKLAHISAFLENDLDISNAMAYVFSITKSINTHVEGEKEHDYELLALVKSEMEKLFYIIGLEKEEKKILDEKTRELVSSLVAQRDEARKNKDYATSDQIRKQLGEMGIIVEDGAKAKWKIA